jgi:hypothetical protein
VSSCPGCANPSGGLLIVGCRACSLRDLAAGPLFWQSMNLGKLTPAYRAALLCLGDDAAAVHLEVKAAAKTIHRGAIRA